jgi:hypothetical protein
LAGGRERRAYADPFDMVAIGFSESAMRPNIRLTPIFERFDQHPGCGL